MGNLKDWGVDFDEIDELVTDNASLRSFVMGYLAELKCRDNFFLVDDRVQGLQKYDDHDRTKKGDIAVKYRDQEFNIEVKSLQTNTIRLPRPKPKKPPKGWTSPYLADTSRIATFQCDASDKRKVTFADGSDVNTTCLLVGEFDVLAVCLFGFDGRWEFVFAKNQDLPRVKGTRGASKKYTDYQRDNLLSTSMPMLYPTAPSIYAEDPFELFDQIIVDRAAGRIQDEVRDLKRIPKKSEDGAEEQIHEELVGDETDEEDAA